MRYNASSATTAGHNTQSNLLPHHLPAFRSKRVPPLIVQKQKGPQIS